MAPAIPFITMAVSALSAVGSAQSAQQQADIAALSDKRDAEIAEANAEITLAQAGAREEQLRREQRQKLGASRAAIAQSGTGLLGSNADIYSAQARDAEMDALNLRYSGNLEATSLLNQKNTSLFNSAANTASGKAARNAGYVRAGATILSGPNGGGYGGSQPKISTFSGPR
jgi:hypothetical protein